MSEPQEPFVGEHGQVLTPLSDRTWKGRRLGDMTREVLMEALAEACRWSGYLTGAPAVVVASVDTVARAVVPCVGLPAVLSDDDRSDARAAPEPRSER